MLKTPYTIIPGAAIIAVLLLPCISAATEVSDVQDKRPMIDSMRVRPDVSTEATFRREFQARVDDYVAMRFWLRESNGLEAGDTDWFESDEDVPSELLCLPNPPPPATIMGREERQLFPDLSVDDDGATGVLFTRELEDRFREVIAKVLAPFDQARVLRVMPLFPTGVPLQVVSEELFRALPTLPAGLEYRFRERDFLVVDLDTNRVVDSIWLVIGPSGASRQ
jgi:hypothetical protein